MRYFSVARNLDAQRGFCQDAVDILVVKKLAFGWACDQTFSTKLLTGRVLVSYDDAERQDMWLE